MLVAAAPLVLGVFALILVPESPRWLALRGAAGQQAAAPVSVWEVFHPPALKFTLAGVLLATIPLIGGWVVRTG